MTWIETIDYDQADGRLRAAYDRIRAPDGTIDNILVAHSQRPHTLEGHMALYKSVLHHFGNQLPKWLAEAIGVRVSVLNGCDYCVEHHSAGLRRILAGEARADRLLEALRSGALDTAFEPAEAAALAYAEKLTTRPSSVEQADIVALRKAGYDDGQILEINQVAAYFAYANRTVLGLGVDTEGEVLGLSPADAERPDDWHHR